MDRHKSFMKMALELAEKGKGSTSPNPMVGAVIAKKGKIIATGYHRLAGTLHAEALALKKAGPSAKGATLYINLEPCAHTGRTPPCVDAIIKSKIKKVYCAMVDPNPLNNGRGIEILRKNNIDVRVGLLREEAERLNEVFIKYITENRPFITLKLAESLDGKIATRTGNSKWITSEGAREYGYRLRSEVDAILVGVNTIIRDNPLLISRKRRSPVKILLDGRFRVPESARVFTEKSPALNIVAVLKKSFNNRAGLEKAIRMNKRGILVIGFPERNGKIDLGELLKELAELEISHVLVEGGGETVAGFIENRLVDRVMFFIAPKIIGGRAAVTSVEGEGVTEVKNAVILKKVEIEKIGGDILIKGDVRSQTS